MAEYTLLYILFAPFVGAILLLFIPNRRPLQVRFVAAGSAFVSLIASLYLFYAYDPAKGGFQFLQRYEWSKELGIQFFLGVDGIGTPLVLASSILLFAGIFISWHIKDRTKEFYICSVDSRRRHDRRLHVPWIYSFSTSSMKCRCSPCTCCWACGAATRRSISK